MPMMHVVREAGARHFAVLSTLSKYINRRYALSRSQVAIAIVYFALKPYAEGYLSRRGPK